MKKNRIITLVVAVMLVLPNTVFASGMDGRSANSGRGRAAAEARVNITQEKVQVAVQKRQDKKSAAEERKVEALQKKAEGQQRKEEAQQKREASQEFRKAMREKHEIMKENTRKSIELKKEIAEKRSELAVILAELSREEKTFSPELLEELLTKVKELRGIGEAVNSFRALNGDVKKAREHIRSNTYNNALAAIDSVIEKQRIRLQALEEMNKTLDQLLQMARQVEKVEE
jgi:hypothetical protein